MVDEIEDADLDFESPSERSGVTGGIELEGDALYSGSALCIEVAANDLNVSLEVVLRDFRDIRFVFPLARGLDLLEKWIGVERYAYMMHTFLKPCLKEKRRYGEGRLFLIFDVMRIYKL